MVRATGKGRGSPEAVEKRRAARAFNALVAEQGTARCADGRTEKRRLRLLRELREGRGGVPLSPIDTLTHAADLLALGETLTSLRRQGVTFPAASEPTPSLRAAAQAVRDTYALPAELFALIGIDLASKGPRRARRGGTK